MSLMVRMGSFVAGALFSAILSGALQGYAIAKLERSAPPAPPAPPAPSPADVAQAVLGGALGATAPWIVGAVAGVAGAVAKSEGAKSFALGSLFVGTLTLTKALSAVIAHLLTRSS